MAATPRTLVEITDQALQLLNHELGITDTLRFLGQFTAGQSDYTKDRKTMFRELSVNEIVC